MIESILPMFVIYEKPMDFPNSYVCRRHDVTPDAVKPSDWIIVGPSLRMVQEALAGKYPGLTRAPRDPQDDPTIVETWF